MYGMIKTHKQSNRARIITSGSGTVAGNLSIFAEKCLFPEVLKIGTRMQDMQHMLNIIHDLNQYRNFIDNCFLSSFDVANMFPSIDSNMGIESVKKILLNTDDNIRCAQCIIEKL